MKGRKSAFLGGTHSEEAKRKMSEGMKQAHRRRRRQRIKDGNKPVPVGNRSYWFSCPKFTVLVVVDSKNKIIEAAPIVARFVGQPRRNLKRWASKFGPVDTQVISIGER